MERSGQELLEKALEIALTVHRGQPDKAKAAYVLHPLRVMLSLQDETEQLVAVLHDVIEDSREKPDLADRWTADRLREVGFPEAVVQPLELVTKLVTEDGGTEKYDEFIRRLQDDPVARHVKMADLLDNMNLRRIKELSSGDLVRLEKYHKAYRHLQELDARASSCLEMSEPQNRPPSNARKHD